MSKINKIGEFVEGVSCAHIWQATGERNNYKCSKCPAKCKKDRGKLIQYDAGVGIL
jgi:tRNA(Ile2) C34 agmatinyltransferase TiaS